MEPSKLLRDDFLFRNALAEKYRFWCCFSKWCWVGNYQSNRDEKVETLEIELKHRVGNNTLRTTAADRLECSEISNGRKQKNQLQLEIDFSRLKIAGASLPVKQNFLLNRREQSDNDSEADVLEFDSSTNRRSCKTKQTNRDEQYAKWIKIIELIKIYRPTSIIKMLMNCTYIEFMITDKL